MTVTVITIGADSFSAYASRAEADSFLAGDIELQAGWAALADTAKDRSLVSATRLIDRQDWQGQKTSAAQPLEFPRTGLADKDGNAIDGATLPQQIEDGSIVLAAMLAAAPSLQAKAVQGSNVRRVKAGSAEVEFFNSTLATGNIFPDRVHDLIGLFLDSATTATAKAFGTGSLTSVEEFGLTDGVT